MNGPANGFMSQEQLSALLAKVKVDADLRQKFEAVTSFDAAVSLAKAAGFDVSVADFAKGQASHILELSDADLESVAGGNIGGDIGRGVGSFIAGIFTKC